MLVSIHVFPGTFYNICTKIVLPFYNTSLLLSGPIIPFHNTHKRVIYRQLLSELFIAWSVETWYIYIDCKFTTSGKLWTNFSAWALGSEVSSSNAIHNTGWSREYSMLRIDLDACDHWRAKPEHDVQWLFPHLIFLHPDDLDIAFNGWRSKQNLKPPKK